jgi:hypothetical protein
LYTLSNLWPDFSFIYMYMYPLIHIMYLGNTNIYIYIYVCIYIYIYIYIYMYIYIMYIIKIYVYMCVDNHFDMLFPGKDYSSHSQHHLLTCSSLCRSRPFGLPSVHVSMSIIIALVQLMLKQSYWWNFRSVASDISRRQNYQVPPVSLALTKFTLCIPQWSRVLGVGLLCRCIYWDLVPQLCIVIGCGFP